jgi:DNA-binding transcriptional ArsR family regulator
LILNRLIRTTERGIDMKELTAILKALADDTRLQMLALLTKRGELCVCDLERALAVSQSSASRHLRHLLNARLVEARREGTWIHYRISTRLTPERQAVLASLQSWEAFRSLDPLVEKRLDDWLADKAQEPIPADAGCACAGVRPAAYSPVALQG